MELHISAFTTNTTPFYALEILILKMLDMMKGLMSLILVVYQALPIWI